MKTLINMTTSKQKTGLMALGSIFTIIGMLLSPITAQQDEFGEITVTKLSVQAPDGDELVRIAADNPHGGEVMIFGTKRRKGEYVSIKVNEYGGSLAIFGNRDTDSRVVIGVNEYGNGTVNTWDKDVYRRGGLHQH